MFGILRYVLALLVVFGHLWSWRQGTFNWAGQYAVFTFYVLSGYLMTLVLNERYGFSPRGLGRYLANRALRIYPPYLALLVASVVALALWPEAARQMGVRFRLPLDASGWLANLAIFGLHTVQPARIIPVSWSLSVELILYVAMGLALSRSRPIVLLWVAVSAAYTAWAVAQGWSLHDRFSPPLAASIAFALGALIYHLRGTHVGRWLLAPAAVVFLGNLLFARMLWNEIKMEGFYVSLVASFVLVWSASQLRVAAAPPWLRRLDSELGDLAYPMFLCHFLAGALMIRFAFGGTRPEHPALMFFASLPLVHALSWAVQRGVERPIAVIRARVRP